MASTALSPAIPFRSAEREKCGGLSDAALMERVRAGDPEAFRPIVERYQRRLYGYFLNLVADPTTAADLAQETFVRVYQAAPRYRESGRFEAWLFCIASNLVRSRKRRQASRGPHLSLDDVSRAAEAQRAGSAASAFAPDESAWRSELREALRRALPRVPLVFREAMLLRDVEGWSYREIAEMLGVREGTVKSRAHRGRQRLRALLAPRFEGAAP